MTSPKKSNEYVKLAEEGKPIPVKEGQIYVMGDDGVPVWTDPGPDTVRLTCGDAKIGSAIYGSLSAVMAELGAIAKDGVNKSQGFKFRGIDQVYNEMHPIMAKHKIFTVPRVLKLLARKERETRNGGTLSFTLLEMEYDFVSGKDGSKITVGPIIGEGMDAGDKGTNKAMAIAHKYALFQLFLIPTEKADDPDGDAYDVKPERTKPVAAKPKAPTSPVAPTPAKQADSNIASDQLKIETVDEARAIANDLIQTADQHTASKAELVKFWKQNKRPLIALRENFTDQYITVESHFKSLSEKAGE